MAKRTLEDTDEDQTSKIQKTDEIEELSFVVHIRNLCTDVTEKEVVQLAFPFGKVKNLILLKAKNQAFIEFFNPINVKEMLNYYGSQLNETSLRGYKLYAQASNHKHLDTTHVPPAAGNIAKSIINTMNALYDANSTQEMPTNILRIKFEGVPSFLNLDVIHQVFGKYGYIQKIITFTKNNTYQAFVQYPFPASAQMARLNLCGMHLNGCLIAKIDFSRLQELEIKQNNDKMRDYTNNLISVEPKLSHTQLHENGSSETTLLLSPNQSGSENFTCVETPTLISSSPQPYHVPTEIRLQSAATLTAPNNNNILYTNALSSQSPYTIIPLPNNLSQQNIGLSSLRGMYGLPLNMIINPTQINALNSAQSGNTFAYNTGKQQIHLQPQPQQPIIIGIDPNSLTASQLTSIILQQQQQQQIGLNKGVISDLVSNPSNIIPGAGGSVIIVSNFNEQKVTADALFIFFGVYGDVLKVKILFNKRDTALIQMSNSTQAHLAINNLDNIKMYGKQIRVSLSKYQNIKMPKETQAEILLTKEYPNSPLHRFKKIGSKNYNNIFPPSPVLHLSNIPIETEESTILEIFNNAGFKIQKFKYFVNEKRMALAQMNDVEEAVAALIELHNHPITNTHNLRISFSKSHF